MDFVSFLAALIWAFGIRTFLYQPFNSPSASMEPTVRVGDYFFVEKFTHRDRYPERGDAVVFYAEAFHSNFLKRIVGLPGDRIQMRDGALFVNGSRMPQRPMSDFIETCGEAVCHVPQYGETFPNGHTIHVLDRDKDGPEDNTGIYVVPPDHYFVLGDNRDNSNDSRMSIGYVPQATIVGRPVLKFFANGHPVLRLMD